MIEPTLTVKVEPPTTPTVNNIEQIHYALTENTMVKGKKSKLIYSIYYNPHWLYGLLW
jgi:hypothetical protein